MLHGLLALASSPQAETRQLVDDAIVALSGPIAPSEARDTLTDLRVGKGECPILAARASGCHLHVPTSSSSRPILPKPLLVLERMLADVQRHARASQVSVVLTRDNLVQLRVSDNGVGFVLCFLFQVTTALLIR